MQLAWSLWRSCQQPSVAMSKNEIVVDDPSRKQRYKHIKYTSKAFRFSFSRSIFYMTNRLEEGNKTSQIFVSPIAGWGEEKNTLSTMLACSRQSYTFSIMRAPNLTECMSIDVNEREKKKSCQCLGNSFAFFLLWSCPKNVQCMKCQIAIQPIAVDWNVIGLLPPSSL